MTHGRRIARGPDDAVNLKLTGGPDAAAKARRALAKLRGDIDPPLLETLRLLVTELVANSVKHAEAHDIELKVLVTGPAVLTEVTDRGPGFEPRPREDGQDDASGWGLFLVERLADRWGVTRDGQANRVWFELRRI
jgi:anti-sigma regulatory factor (Ser/Thr protein kinase)